MALAQCHWKKGDLIQAKSYLQEALHANESKEALQEMSIITRQIKTKQEDTAAIIDESITLAKRALQLDLHDHKSWYILGNAYCMKFFSGIQDINDLSKAISAYNRSELLGGGCNPDLHYNKGNVSRYLQDYGGAMRGYSHAYEIDSSFNSSIESLEDVQVFLNRCCEMVLHKGWIKKKMRDRALQQIQNAISKFQSSSSLSMKQAKQFSNLEAGENLNTVVHTRILLPATKNSTPPECFLCIDSNGECALLAIYNLGADASTLLTTGDHVISIVDATYRKPYFHSHPSSEFAEDKPSSSSSGLNHQASTSEGENGEGDTSNSGTSNSNRGGGIFDVTRYTDEYISTVSTPPILQALRIDGIFVDGVPLPRRSIAPPRLKVDLYE